MENFGNIKDTFGKIILESVIKKDKAGKKIFSTYLKTLKENKSLKDQFLIYRNLESRKFEDRSEAKEYIKENIDLLKKLNKKEITEGTTTLIKLLGNNKIVKENSNFYGDIVLLSTIKKGPGNIDKINESLNRLADHMTTKEEVTEATERVDISPSVLTKMFVNKFNQKYSDITESEKAILKTVLNGNSSDRENTFNNLRRECIDSVDTKLSETTDLELKEKLLKVKDKLLNTEFIKESFTNDVIKLYNLKDTINNE